MDHLCPKCRKPSGVAVEDVCGRCEACGADLVYCFGEVVDGDTEVRLIERIEADRTALHHDLARVKS